MKRAAILGLCALLHLGMPRLLHAEVLDRVVAIIDNTTIVTLSDIRKEQALRVALGDPPESDDKILDGLIERHLIEDQLAQFRAIEIDSSLVDERVRETKASPGISAQDVRKAIEAEMRRFEFLIQRFRQFIRVSDEEARKYYDEVFVPELQKRGSPIPSVEDGLALVRPNVIAEKMNQEVGAWLADLRRRSVVEKILN